MRHIRFADCEYKPDKTSRKRADAGDEENDHSHDYRMDDRGDPKEKPENCKDGKKQRGFPAPGESAESMIAANESTRMRIPMSSTSTVADIFGKSTNKKPEYHREYSKKDKRDPFDTGDIFNRNCVRGHR